MNPARFFLYRSWFELSAVACSLPDNVLLLWTDSEAVACLKKGKHGTQESTCGTLWECLDISPGIPKRRKEKEKKSSGKSRGLLNTNRHTKSGAAQCTGSVLFGVSCVTSLASGPQRALNPCSGTLSVLFVDGLMAAGQPGKED